MTSSRSRLSVVVATRDRPQQLATCLLALSGDIGAEDELIVVDSASGDAAAVREATAGCPRPLRLLRAAAPGTSLARNLGWRAAAADLVAFVDDDVEVHRGWADAIVAAFDGPDVGFVTGWIGVPDHQQGVAEPNPAMTVPAAFVIDRRRHGLLGAGANLAARSTALARVGGFDERLGPGTRLRAGEDHDLMDRLLAAGVTGRYTPAARVDHDQWRSRRQSLALHWRIGLGSGARLTRLARRDRERLPGVARELLADDIGRSLLRSLRAGYQTGTVFALLRLGGLLAGALLALPLR
jgi:glycosyltransferase involved in cell wall biosynthesis